LMSVAAVMTCQERGGVQTRQRGKKWGGAKEDICKDSSYKQHAKENFLTNLRSTGDRINLKKEKRVIKTTGAGETERWAGL